MAEVYLRCEQHYKPGSVFDDHLSRLYVAVQLPLDVSAQRRDLPEGTTGRRIAFPAETSGHLVLLQVGFTRLFLLPERRWSLTPPFHPYRLKTAVFFLLHFPWSFLHRTLSGTLPCEARTFLDAFAARPSVLLNTAYCTMKKSSCKAAFFS